MNQVLVQFVYSFLAEFVEPLLFFLEGKYACCTQLEHPSRERFTIYNYCGYLPGRLASVRLDYDSSKVISLSYLFFAFVLTRHSRFKRAMHAPTCSSCGFSLIFVVFLGTVQGRKKGDSRCSTWWAGTSGHGEKERKEKE